MTMKLPFTKVSMAVDAKWQSSTKGVNGTGRRVRQRRLVLFFCGQPREMIVWRCLETLPSDNCRAFRSEVCQQKLKTWKTPQPGWTN
ncbi:hypothetical protein PoB_003580700 [Plakobranchus ocellatus]|uniref:Uncharacterized protein n=1 Tax=Plakobranchus ocellatus TaxID=259542 RepID=A0AAV4AQU3_9GAST|nr:hypothetical protein PoB_003580700 [Plakobranchus ocellatus]